MKKKFIDFMLNKFPAKSLVILFAAVAVVFFFFRGCLRADEPALISYKTKIEYVPKIEIVKVPEYIYPSKIQIQSIVDSALRARKEKENILLAGELRNKKKGEKQLIKDSKFLDLQYISPQDSVFNVTYEIPIDLGFKFDNNAGVYISQQEVKRRRFWQSVETIAVRAAPVAAFVLGCIIGGKN